MTAAPGLCWRGRVLRWSGRQLARLSPGSRLRLARALTHLPGLAGRRRRIVRINVERCFPALGPAQRDMLVDASLQSAAAGALEALCAWYGPAGALAGQARIDGLQHLHAALASGHGAVVLGAHYDGIELAMRHVAEAARAPMPILVRRHNDPCIEAAIAQGRAAYAGATYDKKDIAGFAAQVRAGSAVFYVPDQDAARRTVFVPFMGLQAATLGAIGGVLERCGGTPLLMWARRDDDGVQHIDIEPAPEDWPSADPVDTAARYMAWVQRRLAPAPAQYLWAHRRFKTRPPGEPPFY